MAVPRHCRLEHLARILAVYAGPAHRLRKRLPPQFPAAAARAVGVHVHGHKNDGQPFQLFHESGGQVPKVGRAHGQHGAACPGGPMHQHGVKLRLHHHAGRSSAEGPRLHGQEKRRAAAAGHDVVFQVRERCFSVGIRAADADAFHAAVSRKAGNHYAAGNPHGTTHTASGFAWCFFRQTPVFAQAHDVGAAVFPALPAEPVFPHGDFIQTARRQVLTGLRLRPERLMPGFDKMRGFRAPLGGVARRFRHCLSIESRRSLFTLLRLLRRTFHRAILPRPAGGLRRLPEGHAFHVHEPLDDVAADAALTAAVGAPAVVLLGPYEKTVSAAAERTRPGKLRAAAVAALALQRKAPRRVQVGNGQHAAPPHIRQASRQAMMICRKAAGASAMTP